MGTDATKTVDDENSGLIKRKSGAGKPDSSVSGDTSGFRRSTRSQNNSSPGSSIRKSQRLEKRPPEMEMTSPLRRSARGNMYRSPSAGKPPESINKRGSRKDKEKVGDKRKKRLDARQFRAMFELKNAESSETESKKRRLENCCSNAESGVGDPSEETSENCEKLVDSGLGNSENGLERNCDEDVDGAFEETQEEPQERSDEEKKEDDCATSTDADCSLANPDKGLPENIDDLERGIEKPEDEPKECSGGQNKEGCVMNTNGKSGLGNLNKGLPDNCYEDGDRGIKEPEEEPQECSNGEDKKDTLTKTNGAIEGFDLKNKKPCDLEDGEGQLASRDANLLFPSTSESLADRNSVNVVSCEVEKSSNQEIPSGSGRPSDNGNGSVSGVGDEGMHTNTEFISSGSPSFKRSSLIGDGSKCSKDTRLHRDSSQHGIHCYLTNSISGANSVSISKDRGDYSDAANEGCQKTNRSDPSVDADQGSCVTCKGVGNLLWGGIPLTCFGLLIRSLKEKQYFIKYKGLAHIHNCWIPETQLLYEAPELFVKLNDQDKSWNPEWAVPHRLLLRRSMIADKEDADFASESRYEWLVKWRDLDYDQATWEFEDSEFFKKPETQQLLKEYESRRNGDRRSFQQLWKDCETHPNEFRNSIMSGDNKIQERRKNIHVKHGRLSDSLRLESVNKLRDFYQKRHNVVLLDEQDRAMKIIYFISSILSSVRQPFLIIAPRESLSFWEAEFLRFTSSINVVVYGGNTVSRKIIRSLEFFREGGVLMLQVLLSSYEAFIEDLEEIRRVDWEAVIIDDSQEHCILGNSDCFKTLVTHWRLLLFNAQLKDTVAEYVNILSLLDPVGSSNQYEGLIDASKTDINVLKERMCSFIISPKFQEYWVPVEISNVQLEQYCSTILSNSSVLGSCSKSDPIGSLHDILISTQKAVKNIISSYCALCSSFLDCCDHPYLVNPSLRKFLLPEQPPQDAALDMGVKASGKLLLLDKLLSEFRNQGLKVLILFQPVGGFGKDNLDIILDDFLTWRFGEDSYEHIACGGQPSTKKAALNKFNRERNRSFLLLETRACSPSIKLSLVDSVIILNSDWNPLNDLRALQRIMIDSKLKPLNIFRFYCSCTVEEKALIIAKNDTIPENTHQINPSTKRMLLMWGCSYLFSRLDEFHRDKVFDYKDNIAFGASVVRDVCEEVVSVVQNQGNINQSRYISLARQDGRCYFTSIPLLGEPRTQLDKGVSSQTILVKLLEGKQPQWKYLSRSSERNRKRVHYTDELSLPPNVPTDEPAKKRKDSSPRRVGQNPEKIKDRNKEHHGNPDMREPGNRRDLHDQRGLFDMLKPNVLQLCETLMVKDEVKRLAEDFLEFVLNNHQVTREPETIFQAFQISLCWIAVEVLEKKVDHKKSLDIVREKMNFKCVEEETDSVYSKMKQLMKIFLSRNLRSLKSPVNPSSALDDSRRVLNENCVDISVDNVDKTTALDESTLVNKQNPSQLQRTNNEPDSLESADKLKKKCEKKIRRIKEKQNEELVNFEKVWERKRAELEDTYKLESAFVRYSHAKSTALVDKLKILDMDYAMKTKDLESKVSNLRKEIEARHQEEIDGEEKKIAQLFMLVKPLVQTELVENLQSVNSTQFQKAEAVVPDKGSNSILPIAENLPEDRNSGGEASGTHHAATPPYSVENNLSMENQRSAPAGGMAEAADQIDAVLVDRPSIPESDRSNGVSTSFYCESTEQFRSSVMNQQSADETSCQVEGVEVRVCPLTEICDTSPGGETSLLDPADPVPSNLPHDEVRNNLPAAEVSVPMSAGYRQIRVASSGQLINQPIEVTVSAQNSCTQMQQNIPQLVAARAADANIRLGMTYVSVIRGASMARASHSNPAPVVTPTMSLASPSYHSDPLQNEYDRIRKEIREVMNARDEMKLRLRSECDKEIEEVVAQIRKKYDVKLEEAESLYSLKKNELEMNQNMVMMNKLLADALRSNYADSKAAPQGGSQKGMSSRSKDPLVQRQSTPRSLSAASLSVAPDGNPAPSRDVHLSPVLSSSVPSRSTLIESSSARLDIPAALHHLQHMSAPSVTLPSNIQSSRVPPLQPSNNPPSSQPPAFNLTLSADFIDMARQNEANVRLLAGNLPLLPDDIQNQDSLVSLFATAADVQQLAGEVVCLSDDD
ncbi:hypothetical protein KSS87_011018 [Heliosperma pusillum]|nr:hypothetical protein KSS87_014114 [Heliosperma pusillum]KAH9614498.1 hypothetical protein KSS87_011018 [Heliosperma pusillum]